MLRGSRLARGSAGPSGGKAGCARPPGGGGGQGHPGGRVGMDVRGPLRSQFLMVLPGLLVAGA